MSALSASAALQWLIQGPLLIVASICGGLLGSAFNMLKRRNRFWRQQHPGIAWRLLEAAGVALITATALIVLPAVAGTCLQVRRRCWFVRAGCEATVIVRQHLYCSSIILSPILDPPIVCLCPADPRTVGCGRGVPWQLPRGAVQ